jgi:DNA-directed RNA polymerase specialized sigma24 family protein
MPQDRQAQLRRRARKAAASLSAIEFKVLALAARDGLSNAQIGARLGLAPGTVGQILARALWKFDRALRRQEQPWWSFWRRKHR